MQPLRVQHEPGPATRPDDDALDLSETWVYRGSSAPTGAEQPASPARLLREELAMRLGELAMPTGTDTGAAVLAVETKWPVPARIATILAISLALWGGIYLAVMRIITG